MTHTYIIQNLGCANCAAKMEGKIAALPQVEEATITFATRQLRLTAPDPEALLPQIRRIVSSIEPEAKVVEKGHHDDHHHDHCHCGHEHHHHHDHHPSGEALPIVIGAVLFAAGLVLQALSLDLIAKGVLVVSYLALGFPVLKTAATGLLRGQLFDENFLMSIATIGAFFIDEFPEAVGIMLFYRIGELFEHMAVERSRKQIMEAVDLRPETVILADGKQIPAEDVQVGDLLRIRPGDRIGLDATVVTGESRIDTSPITGEPVPVHVGPGDAVTSGCVNGSGPLTVRVEQPLSGSMVTRILEFVEEAAAGKPKLDRFITRFAKIYTPIVVLSAVAVAVIPSLFTGNWSYWVYTALSFLVMSCPCALVLSVPLAFFSGIGIGSRKGILFKGGAAIEATAAIRAIVLDKTGTITRGDFTVQQVVGGDEVLALCAACEQHSTHPIAESIVAAAKGLTLATPTQVQEIPGHGIEATLEGSRILCGNQALMARHGINVQPEGNGAVVYVAKDGVYLGQILISDTIKPEAATAIAAVNALGIHTAMLTGDREATARTVAGSVGIREIHAQLLPQEKLEHLRQIRQDHGPTMFVGDGINDAPVLSGADVGAAMGSGADAAIEAADLVFLNSQVSAIPQALTIARRTRSIARQNILFALTIKAIVMILGLLGHASMWAAVFADSGVAMLCVLNSIRMLYQKTT